MNFKPSKLCAGNNLLYCKENSNAQQTFIISSISDFISEVLIFASGWTATGADIVRDF